MSAPHTSKADRDQLDDHNVVALDHRVGLATARPACGGGAGAVSPNDSRPGIGNDTGATSKSIGKDYSQITPRGYIGTPAREVAGV